MYISIKADWNEAHGGSLFQDADTFTCSSEMFR